MFRNSSSRPVDRHRGQPSSPLCRAPYALAIGRSSNPGFLRLTPRRLDAAQRGTQRRMSPDSLPVIMPRPPDSRYVRLESDMESYVRLWRYHTPRQSGPKNLREGDVRLLGPPTCYIIMPQIMVVLLWRSGPRSPVACRQPLRVLRCGLCPTCWRPVLVEWRDHVTLSSMRLGRCHLTPAYCVRRRQAVAAVPVTSIPGRTG